ncbi:unnamed protein product, partial [Didymodactylos carnosus]
MPATSEFIPLIGIYFTIVMGLTSGSVLLAVMILNIHLYGSSLTPVPKPLRKLLFIRLAPVLCVKLHCATLHTKEPKNSRSTGQRPRSTTVYNAVFLGEQDLINDHHIFNSTYLNSNHVNTTTSVATSNIENNASYLSNTNSPLNETKRFPHEFKYTNTDSIPTVHTLQECKSLLGELNRIILNDKPERIEEDEISRDWQNVALVIDRLLFYTYIIFTVLVTLITLVIAPLMKTIPLLPEERQLNLT